jgi:hypothetical protein
LDLMLLASENFCFMYSMATLEFSVINADNSKETIFSETETR